jgi:hypothetical protein
VSETCRRDALSNVYTFAWGRGVLSPSSEEVSCMDGLP